MMKSLLLILNLMLGVVLVKAQQPYATVQGRYITEMEKEIYLFEVKDGDLAEYASTKLGKDGSFAFTLVPQGSRFYYIGNKDNYYRIYLQEGKILNVKIDVENNQMDLVGKTSKEANLVHEWWKLIHDVEVKAVKQAGMRSTYTDFYPTLMETVAEYEKFCSRIDTKDEEFVREFRYLIDSDIRYYALAFLASGRIEHPEQGNITDFHRKILEEKLIDKQVLKLPYAWRYIYAVASVVRVHGGGYKQANAIDYILSQMDDSELKSLFILQELPKKRRSAEQFNDFMKMYGQYLCLPEHKNAAANLGKDFKSIEAGKEAIDFSYPDVDGKIHSLSDYKGKVVVVDVWATWCGPCMKELPFFRKLEEEFCDNKDVVFIGVSMDRKKSEWMDYVKKEQLEGVQLLGDNLIRDNYKIKGIPRFMLFDKEGKIITTDAPRPSTPLLRAMINEALNK